MFLEITEKEGMPERILFYWDEERSFLVGMAGSVGEDSFVWKKIEEIEEDWPFLASMRATYVLLVGRDHNEERAWFYSRTLQTRALEFLNYLFDERGLVKGSSYSAAAIISQALLWTQISGEGQEGLKDHFLSRAGAYFVDCDWIFAEEYAKTHKEEILAQPRYKKRHIPWSFVRTLEIAPAGQLLFVRSLENEAGLEVESSGDTIIMIGTQGEIYHIDTEKFESTYEATDEPLDIFANMTLFLPEVRVLPDGDYINIDEMAHVCYPKPGKAIHAKKIEKRTKIFPVYSPDSYFLGRIGDYMVTRTDDLSDIYIVQEKIFERTYEEIDQDD